MFGRQRADRRGHRVVGKCGGGHGIGLRRVEQEGRVRGENRMEQRLLPARAELAEAVLLVEQGGDARQVRLGHGRRDETAQAHRTALQRLAFEFRDECGHVVKRQRACFQLARQIVAELEHRIEKRGLGGALVQRLEALAQLCNGLHHPVPLACPCRPDGLAALHHARCVRCWKGPRPGAPGARSPPRRACPWGRPSCRRRRAPDRRRATRAPTPD